MGFAEFVFGDCYHVVKVEFGAGDFCDDVVHELASFFRGVIDLGVVVFWTGFDDVIEGFVIAPHEAVKVGAELEIVVLGAVFEGGFATGFDLLGVPPVVVAFGWGVSWRIYDVVTADGIVCFAREYVDLGDLLFFLLSGWFDMGLKWVVISGGRGVF